MKLNTLKRLVSLGVLLAVVSAPYVNGSAFPCGTPASVYAESGESGTFS